MNQSVNKLMDKKMDLLESEVRGQYLILSHVQLELYESLPKVLEIVVVVLISTIIMQWQWSIYNTLALLGSLSRFLQCRSQ